MKTLYTLTILIAIISCKKPEEPKPSVETTVNGVELTMGTPQIKSIENEEHFIARSLNGSEIDFNLGSTIESSYVFTESGLFGFDEKIELFHDGAFYYVRDSVGQFYVNTQTVDGLIHGSFSGSLINYSGDVVDLSGSFKNLF